MAYALITGSNKGIGKYIAIELAAKGYDLLLVARNENDLATVAKEITGQYKVKVAYLSNDLSKADAAKNVYDWCVRENYLPAIQVLVNNAGYGVSGLFMNHDIAAHTAMMQVNMQALVEMCYYFIPHLQKQSQAYLLNIASSAAYQAVPYLSAYAASKAFVLNFSRGLRYELKNTSVSVTCVSPGSTDTAFAERAGVNSPKAVKMAAKVNMTPEVVAQMAVKAMFAKKTELITGWLNKLTVFFVGLMPKKFVEKTAAGIYE